MGPGDRWVEGGRASGSTDAATKETGEHAEIAASDDEEEVNAEAVEKFMEQYKVRLVENLGGDGRVYVL